MRRLRLLDVSVNVRQRAERYLERTFYDLTTMALHDWQTYGEMRVLAREKYGLQLTDSHLPMGTLDQVRTPLRVRPCVRERAPTPLRFRAWTCCRSCATSTCL